MDSDTDLAPSGRSPHLSLAHLYWRKILSTGDTVIDATAGNGHDTLVISSLVLSPREGNVYAIDIQQEAIDRTRKRLEESLSPLLSSRIHFICACHSTLGCLIPPEHKPKLIVYNLGYLPGGDKKRTTEYSTTVASLIAAEELLRPNGMISVTCYPGHDAGVIEEQTVSDHIRSLPTDCWSSCYHHRPDRQRAPSLWILRKL